MHAFFLFQIFLLIFIISIANCSNIGFFCNCGPYSHDAYTNHLTETLASRGFGHNISIIQIWIFKFNKKVKFSQRYIYHDFTNDSQVIEEQRNALKLIWQVSIPFDNENVTGSITGIKSALRIQKMYTRGCASALENRTFIRQVKNLKLDLMIIDYSINDCAIGFADMLHVPAAYISSVAFGSNYLDYLGVPTNPGYVPLYFCNFEPYTMFYDRALNTFGYINIVGFRRLFYYRAYNAFYEKLDVQLSDLEPLERRTLIFGTLWELFLDAPRPLARHMKYFGCENCAISLEKHEKSNFTSHIAGVILVSFGTLTNAEEIPVEKLRSFVKAFSYYPTYTFLWQLDVSEDYFKNTVLMPADLKLPGHVHLRRWIPMKQMLLDPSVVLVITHGGANTCLEAAYAGVPVLVIAIHSDQYFNSQRMAVRGLGDTFTVTEISEIRIVWYLNSILPDQKIFKARAKKFRQMLIDYRQFENTPSAFWINYVARHFGGHDNEAKIRADKYWLLRHPGNWLIYHNFDVIAAVVLMSWSFIVIIP